MHYIAEHVGISGDVKRYLCSFYLSTFSALPHHRRNHPS
jgi:hypothetical protein